MVHGTSDLAQRISQDVRRLDHAQQNALRATAFVRLISSRNSCLDGLKVTRPCARVARRRWSTALTTFPSSQSSMDRSDYEAAADYLQRYQDLEREAVSLGASSASSSVRGCHLVGRLVRGSARFTGQHFPPVQATPDQQALLEEVRRQLATVARARCQEALQKGDHATVVRFTRLFPALGLAQEGLESFASYLRGLISKRAREDFGALSDGLARATDPAQTGTLFAETLSNIFRDAATAVEENRRMLSERFGPQGLVHVSKAVHAEVEGRAIAVLRRFLEVRRVEQTQQQITQRPRRVMTQSPPQPSAASASGEEDPLDPRRVETLIEDLVGLIRRGEDYLGYIVLQLRDALVASQLQQDIQQAQQQLSPQGAATAAATATGADPTSAATTQAEASVRPGPLNVLLRELLGGSLVLTRCSLQRLRARAAAAAPCFRAGHYMSLEEFYLDETVRKAIRLDERVEGSLTTSMVDDVFFLLLKASRRALATGSAQCASAVISQINNVLCNQFRGALEARLQGGPARLLAAMPPVSQEEADLREIAGRALGGRAPEEEALDHAAAINNLDVSSEYVRKLKMELEVGEMAARDRSVWLGWAVLCRELHVYLFLLPQMRACRSRMSQGLSERLYAGSAKDRDRVEGVLSDLQKTAGDLRAWAQQCIEQVSRALQPQVRPLLDELAGVSYELTEIQYARNEADDSWWARIVLESLRRGLVWLQPLLSPAVFDGLVGSLLEAVGSRVEALLLQKRFNQLGGLQLDRDVRTLVQGFSDLTQRTVRDKFARLGQMATILGLEEASEVIEYWGEGKASITWRLTSAEVKQIMALRRDFRPEAIGSLKL